MCVCVGACCTDKPDRLKKGEDGGKVRDEMMVTDVVKVYLIRQKYNEYH